MSTGDPRPARRLRVYVGERDRTRQGHPLWEAIVEAAHERGLAGATVVKALSGYGARSRVHTAKILRLSEDLPLVIEIIDGPERIEAFAAWLDGELTGGMVTVESCEVRIYRGGDDG